MNTLTIAICARRAEGIIGACLESIQAQTIKPDEILVAVDEMDDPTVDVARHYGARVIASNATGLYEARNAVLEACTTDYLAFTDADCVLVPEWVALARHVLDTRPEIAAGTGRHPPIGVKNFASWLHHMWYIVETESTGPAKGLIGGNSYFRTEALRDVGGWLNLPRHSAAEDVYIAEALTRAGHGLWFETGAAAQHNYETRLSGLWRKSVMMGKDIVVMMRAARWFGPLWWYTLAIPLMALTLVIGIFLLFIAPVVGAAVVCGALLGSLAYLCVSLRGFISVVPRWAARWILIWPYSWGVVKGLFVPLPPEYANPGTKRP